MWQLLVCLGEPCGRHRVARLRRLAGIVKTEVVCPQITDLKCPLFTDEFVQSSGSGRGLSRPLLCRGGGPAPQQPRFLFLPQPVALPLDIQGRGMVQEPVEDGRGQDMIIEDLAPVGEALVVGDDQAPPLVAPDQEPEEQAGLLPRERQIAQLVEDEQPGIDQLLQGSLQPVSHAGPAPVGP